MGTDEGQFDFETLCVERAGYVVLTRQFRTASKPLVAWSSSQEMGFHHKKDPFLEPAGYTTPPVLITSFLCSRNKDSLRRT